MTRRDLDFVSLERRAFSAPVKNDRRAESPSLQSGADGPVLVETEAA
jgi:hypothetical protein